MFSQIQSIFVTILLLPCFLQAQDLEVSSITTADGLSQGMIFTIKKDTDGFIWVGTKNGLNRYDGYDFKVFTNDPFDSLSISGDVIRNISEGSKGRYWILTESNGLNYFDKEKELFYSVKTDSDDINAIIDNNDISYTKEVLNGDLWINSPKGLIRFVISDFEKELQTGFSAKLYPNSRQIRFDKDGTIWAMSQHDIVYWDRDQEDFIPIPQMFSKNDQPAAKKRIVTSSQESGIWVLEKQNNQYTFHRIKEAGAEIETFYLKNTDLYKKNKNRSTSLRFFFFIPALQEYWINFQFDPTFYALDFNSSTQDLSARPVFSLKEKEYPTTYCFVDEETLWIGTSGYGIRKVSLKPKKFRHLMPNKSVMNISLLGEEGMLTRVYSDIYFLPNPADTFFLSDHHNKLPNGLKQVLKTQDNSYWGDMKKYGSFIKLNKNFEKEKEYLIPSKYSPHKLFEKDAIDNLWISSLIYDLLHLDHKTDSISVFDCQEFDDSAELNRAQCLYLDTQNNLWKGQRKGLKKITLDEKGQVIDCQFFQNIPTDRTSLRNNSVSSCLDDPIDPNTYLWVGTRGGGLNKLNKKTGKFEHFTTEDGLSNNVVQGILADEENKLWLSTNNGLSQFDPIQKTFKNYNVTDGLQDDQFNTFSYAKNEKTGEMFFGGINGITAFFPKDLKTDKAISNTYITQLKINNEPVNVGKPLKNNKPNPLQKAMYLTEEMDLTWEQNQLSFKFASIDFHDSYKCIYKYKLSPIDKDWVNADESRLANYANLAVGSYVFEVKGTNSDGIWNETPARLEIRIHPPWWRTWWAYGAYFLLIAFTVFKIYQFQINEKHLQNQLLFEQKEAERLADLDKMKTNFFTNITHEFRTPLTLVIEPLRQVLEQPQKDWKDKVLLAKNNSQKLLGLINQLLDLSKLEHKKMGINLTHGNILELVEAIVLSFQPIAKKQGILLQYRHPEILPNSDFDKDKIEKILRNLLHNALKFTPKKGTVALTITLENQATPQLALSVSDTGVGISKENQKYIFDRFYQVDASTTRKGEGTGIGLALTKELVELLGGTITLESVEGKGSTFKILVPFLAKETSKTMAAISQTPSLVSNEIKILDAATISTKTPLTASQHKLDATNVALVIEDNEELRTFIKMSIEANYQVLEAKNGKEGTEMALEHIPNIIISDIMMPEMDGFEVCQHLKTDLKTSHIPIILLTGKTAFESRIQGLKYGADAYMNKPFHTTELLVRMEKLIELRQHLQIKFSQQFFAKAATDSSPKPSETKSPHEHSELEEQFLNELRSYILAQYHDPNLSVDDIAQEVRMSRAQLYRKLGALINQTPSKLIKEIRLQAAMNLLKTKKGNVTEIAEMVGFSSQKYFSTQFKEKYGISPKKVG